MMKNQGKTMELREPIKLNPVENLNVDGGKDQSDKEAATKESCQKNISAVTRRKQRKC